MTEKWLQRILRIVLLAALLTVFGIYLVRCASLDRSGLFDGTLRWQGRTYSQSYGYYCEDVQLAVATDAGGGKWDVISVEGDPMGEQFVVLRSFLDQYLYQNEAYVVPNSGEVTAVFLDYKRYTDQTLLNTLRRAMETERAAEPIVCDLQSLKACAVAFCYEGCAVAPGTVGWITVIDGTWFAARADRDCRVIDEETGWREVLCSPLDAEIARILQNSELFDLE